MGRRKKSQAEVVRAGTFRPSTHGPLTPANRALWKRLWCSPRFCITCGRSIPAEGNTKTCPGECRHQAAQARFVRRREKARSELPARAGAANAGPSQ